MREINITIAIENELYDRTVAVGLSISNTLYEFLLDEGLEYLEGQVEGLERGIAWHNRLVLLCPHCNKQVDIINPVNGHHFTCYKCGKAFKIR